MLAGPCRRTLTSNFVAVPIALNPVPHALEYWVSANTRDQGWSPVQGKNEIMKSATSVERFPCIPFE